MMHTFTIIELLCTQKHAYFTISPRILTEGS